MRGMALLMITTILLAPLAGCAGTDGDITVDLSTEELQDLIDDNKQDFLNNTTVVVFQDYHNNTTFINNYNNSTDFDQSGASSTSSNTTNIYNGSSVENEIFVVNLKWNAIEMFGEIEMKRNNNFTVSYSYYDYATNDDRNDTFTLACSNYYDAPAQSNSSGNNDENSGSNESTFWNNDNIYWDWWDYLYNNTIRDLLGDKGYSDEVENACRESDDNIILNRESYYYYNSDWEQVWDLSQAPIFFEMNLTTGYAINVIRIISQHQYTTNNYIHTNNIDIGINEDRQCQNYHYVICSQGDDELYGGWEDIKLNFQLVGTIYQDSTFSFVMYYELVPVTIHQ